MFEMPMSPDLLAAVGNITIGKETVPHHRTNLLDSGSHFTPVHGLTTNVLTSIRTFKVLDALASLSVSRQERQVVAVGLQLSINTDPKRNKITITVADNDGVSLSTSEYVAEIWGMLRKLSAIYAAERASRVDGGPDTKPDWTGLSPPVPGRLAPADHLIARLARRLYTFTDKKFQHRVNRWWADLRNFTNDLYRHRRHILSPLEANLRVCLIDFSLGLAALKAPRVDWGYVVEVMDAAVRAATPLLENAYTLESMAQEMNSKFKLRRALEKVTSHHRHFRQLVSSASSPRLGRIFTIEGTVENVPDCFDDIQRYTLPDGETEWRDILGEICADNEDLLADEAVMTSVSETLDDMLSGNEHTPCVHCECALAAHYERHRSASSTPPFSYIGVSKLSCMPCHLWLRALAASTGRSYYTRGTHGKWYRGWRTPVPAVGGGTALLEKLMRGVLVERIVATKGVRSGSDSTDASGGTVFEVSSDMAQEDLARVLEHEGKDIE